MPRAEFLAAGDTVIVEIDGIGNPPAKSGDRCMNGKLTASAATSTAGRDSWPPVRPSPMMRAVVLPDGPPDVLREKTLPTPVPAACEVLVQVAAVSIGRLVDLAARAGRHPYPGFSFPHVLGAEHAGVVAAGTVPATSTSRRRPGTCTRCPPRSARRRPRALRCRGRWP
jgi:hypothetical protein